MDCPYIKCWMLEDNTLWSSLKQIRYFEINDTYVIINKGYAGHGEPI